MLNGKKIIVVMPAYNAEKTLKDTFQEVPHDVIDEVILVDDKSTDNTAIVSRELGIETILHNENLGYGGNQKTCYRAALDKGADIVIMLHPDYQYTPKLALSMASMIANGLFDCVLGSRILGIGALKGGMPIYKYIANRLLTLYQNILLRHKLSEYHTGYRAFSKEILETLPLEANSNDFIFDNQMLVQIIYARFSIGEVTCPTLYFEDASSINLQRASKYGLQVLWTTVQCLLHQWGIAKNAMFQPLDQLRRERQVE
ncbi:MAG: glycosyltransferase family 2 protein [Pseudomonadota bacterium]